MSDNFDLATHYPWLPSSLIKYYNNLPEDPKEFISEIFSSSISEEIGERTFEIFKAAFNNLENVLYYKLDKLNVYMYLLIKILLIVLNDKILTNRVANLYSKINYYDLLEENDYNIYHICNEELNLNVQYLPEGEVYGNKFYENNQQKFITNFKIFFIDYLNLVANLRDEYRKLINNPLSNGFVFLKKKTLIRLLQEYVRNKIKEVEIKKIIKKDELLNIKGFKELLEKISAAWKNRKDEIEYYEFDGTEDASVYPPCIQEIRSKAKEGQNLIHTERLLILWFLLALNVPVEDTVKFFSTMPDFDQEKTTYQVNFAKRKGYKVYLCETLKSLDLCRANKDKEKICTEGYYSKTQEKQRKISSPLQYVHVRQHRNRRESKNKNYINTNTNK
ncbi:MAG: hypothetical protein WBH31_05225 [Promethearchaeia archaeon]